MLIIPCKCLPSLIRSTPGYLTDATNTTSHRQTPVVVVVVVICADLYKQISTDSVLQNENCIKGDPLTDL